ncbi:MAG: DinB family protein, partial [Chloroflexota bacterium]|nr:DinB family protein [Chloroflexota bacterium]
MTDDKRTIWTENLVQSRQALLAVLHSLTPAQWDAVVFHDSEPQHDSEPWTVSTLISHLIDSERGMSIQVHKIRKGEETMPPGFDLDRWNAGVTQRIGVLSPAELLARLETTRTKTIETMNSLTEAEWSLSGQHPFRGLITIEQY